MTGTVVGTVVGMVIGTAGLAGTVIAVACVVVHRHLVVVTVEGPSMQPTLRHGDRVLVRRTGLRTVRTGQLVVFQRPEWTGSADGAPARWLIKRVAAVAGEPVPEAVSGMVGHRRVPDRRLVVLGDNPARSGDSRHWGYVAEDRFLGVVLRTMSRS
ncbi:S26 family signal peptidase [Virgisporangium aurantiacum]|uniref:S26 family signal peptidase n=1 Tax=Virgisporangium aurantiacum TaxID=175570 RepID=A0A8J4E6D7_9ACTN|nr:S26 family signal peptidase [Virgisporangium aurantiacum]GIJ63970.1 S26 family signal peptidase [Virgisporangium aurantiacum]